MKKHILIKVLVLLLSVCALLCVFTACGESPSGDNGGSGGGSGEQTVDLTKAEIVSATGFNIEENTYKRKVSNATETFNFRENLTVSEKATWVLSRDVYGENTIATKTATLNSGDNNFYIIVTSGDTNTVEVYNFIVRRRPMYTVSFDTLGGTEVTSQNVEEDNNITAPTTEKTGYTFNGWDYDFTMPVTSDKVITANYTPIVYNISYELNGGTNDPSNPTTYTIEDEIITFAIPNKTGYVGVWDIPTLYKGSYDDKTITANYTPTVYKIYYELNGGTNNLANPSTYTIEDEVTFADPTKTAYDFTGWDFTTIPKGTYGDKTIRAYYTPTVYNITYNLNGGSVDIDNPITYTIEDEDITFAIPNKTGYVGVWDIPTLYKGSYGDRTITANYTPIVYNITYELNGGTNDPSNPKTYTIEDEDITFASPTKAGYTFIGWDVETISKGSIDDVTVSASWQINTYNITYELNGGSVETENPSTYTIESDDITFAIPNKTGYDGVWDIPTLYKGSYGDKTITANYTPTVYKIYYELNGGTNNLANPSTYTIEDEDITFASPTKAGYTFTGWDVEGISKGTIGDITVNASYTPVVYNITYNLNGGTNDPSNPTTYTIESEDIIFVAPSEKDGYTFTGWSIPMLTKGSYGDKTITANYTAIFTRDGNSITGLTSHGKTFSTLPIPETIDGVNVTSIGSYAFEDCSSLTSVTIPDSVTSIGNYAFRNCSSLASVKIGNGVTSIGHEAFDYCSSLTSITIPNSVTSIGGWAFCWCDNLTKVNYTGTIDSWCEIYFDSYWGFINKSYSLYINNEIVTEANITNATKISACAFRYCISLTSVTIGDSVTSIGEWAFDGCSSLTSVTIPDSVKSIGDYAFYNCHNLTSVTIPDSVTSIGEGAFSGCSKLQYNEYDNGLYLGNEDNPYLVLVKAKSTDITSCTINENTKVIANFAFNSCGSLTSVTIPDSVTSIGEGAFSGCSKLQYNEYDNGLYLGNEDNPYLVLVKAKSTDITSCTINENTKVIYSSAFSNCRSLTNITIPDSVTSIGNGAFEYCRSLTSITIPDSVTSIGDRAFIVCSSLTSVTIPDSVTSIGYGAFQYCISLTSVTIGDSVTSIGEHAFYNCSSLTSITIPDSVTSIGRSAFSRCSSLTSITIPDSVTSIGSGAFDGCSSLTSVTFKNTNGWNAGSTSLSSSDLSDVSTAAEYLRSTYYNYNWTRS